MSSWVASGPYRSRARSASGPPQRSRASPRYMAAWLQELWVMYMMIWLIRALPSTSSTSPGRRVAGQPGQVVGHPALVVGHGAR